MSILKKLGISNKEFITLTALLFLVIAIPLGVYLARQQQIIKSRATSLNSCPNINIFGLNGPDISNLDSLYRAASFRFIPVAWKDIQPSPEAPFNFSKLHEDIDKTIEDGLVPSIKFCDGDCFPDFARAMERPIENQYCCTAEYVCRVLKDDSQTVTAFQNVVREMVNRYKGSVKNWDYGIEPNCRGYNPQVYAFWLRKFAEAVRSADPTAQIIGGHFSGTPTDYLNAVYDAGGKDSFDKLAFDAYGSGGQALDQSGLLAVHNLMISKGDGHKKIWIGEWGINSNQVGESAQASMIRGGLEYLASTPFIEAAFYHNYECDIGREGCQPGHLGYLGFALYKYVGNSISLKPSFSVFQSAVSACLASPSPSPSASVLRSLSPSPSASPSPSPSASVRATSPTPRASVVSSPSPSVSSNSAGGVESKYDLNYDGVVNSVDVAVLLQEWRKGKNASLIVDFNGDKVVNSFDYAAMRVNIFD